MDQVGLRGAATSIYQTVAQQQSMQFWVYLSQLDAFILSPSLKTYLGVDQKKQLLPMVEARKILRPLNLRRIRRIFVGKYKENHIIEEFSVLSGPHKGETVMITAGVLARRPNGSALLISGLLNDSDSGNGRFFTHAIKSDGTWDWDPLSHQISFSQSYKVMMGYETCPEEFPASFDEWLNKMVHPDDVQKAINSEMAVVNDPANGDYFEGCMRLRHRDGHYIWTLARGAVLSRNKDGIATRVVGYNSNVNLLAKVLDNSTYDAFYDTLTGLYNREFLAQQKKYLESSDAAPVSAIYIDITGLKAANDYLGHDFGDELIRTASSLLMTIVKDLGLAVRLGGDEFIAIIPHCTETRVQMLADMYRQMCEQNNANPNNAFVLPSFGIATMGKDGVTDLKGLITLADKRCQEYKRAHKKEDYEFIRADIFRRSNVMADFKDDRIDPPEVLPELSLGNEAKTKSAN